MKLIWNACGSSTNVATAVQQNNFEQSITFAMLNGVKQSLDMLHIMEPKRAKL